MVEWKNQEQIVDEPIGTDHKFIKYSCVFPMPVAVGN